MKLWRIATKRQAEEDAVEIRRFIAEKMVLTTLMWTFAGFTLEIIGTFTMTAAVLLRSQRIRDVFYAIHEIVIPFLLFPAVFLCAFIIIIPCALIPSVIVYHLTVNFLPQISTYIENVLIVISFIGFVFAVEYILHVSGKIKLHERFFNGNHPFVFGWIGFIEIVVGASLHFI